MVMVETADGGRRDVGDRRILLFSGDSWSFLWQRTMGKVERGMGKTKAQSREKKGNKQPDVRRYACMPPIGGALALIGGVRLTLCLHSPSWWSFGDVATILVSIGGSLTKFAMYSPRSVELGCRCCNVNIRLLADFDEVCYVQPSIGGVWRSLLCTTSNRWSLSLWSLALFFDGLRLTELLMRGLFSSAFDLNLERTCKNLNEIFLDIRRKLKYFRKIKLGKNILAHDCEKSNGVSGHASRLHVIFLDSCVPALKENFSLRGGVDLHRLAD
ncbi:hypothetical protein H5410_014535 [Solanum commersonii]|uniref:Uncharacterized protein n=1 Tax=Solanum commersonii TaxID=4109 RepID=A0A9J5ZRR3_SOLCO|nr:hypothetical protein H5410_014535 [Solanum commersonii]